jgi:hypothetical protein
VHVGLQLHVTLRHIEGMVDMQSQEFLEMADIGLYTFFEQEHESYGGLW